MLEVYPIQKKSEQEEICNKCNINYDVDTLCYAAYSDGILYGAVQFAIHGDAGYIYDLKNANGIDNTESLFVVGRATLNFIDLCDVHKAYYEGEVLNENLIKIIGFKKTDDDKWFVDLNGFFEVPCQH